MPNDLTIHKSQAPAPPQPLAATHATSVADPDPPTQGASAQPLPNPSVRLEPDLGIVVIEVRSESGRVVASIPTASQLAAYRRHSEPIPGAATVSGGSLSGGGTRGQVAGSPGSDVDPAETLTGSAGVARREPQAT